MPPRRTSAARAPSSPLQNKKPIPRKQTTGTVAPTSHAFTASPAADSAVSRLDIERPSVLWSAQFLGVAVLTLALSGCFNALVTYTWGRSVDIAKVNKKPDNVWWLIGGLAIQKHFEIGIGIWLFGLNASHNLLFTYLTQFPHLYLLHTFYLVPLTPLLLNLLVNLLSPAIAIRILSLFFPPRSAASSRKQTLYETLKTDDIVSTLLLTLLSAALQAVPPLASLATYLPVHLAIYFQEIPSLGPVHDKLPNLLIFGMPLVASGFALVQLLNAAQPSLTSEEAADAEERDFNPRKASLSETVAYNLRNIKDLLIWTPETMEGQKLMRTTFILALWITLVTGFLSRVTVAGVGGNFIDETEPFPGAVSVKNGFLGKEQLKRDLDAGWQDAKGPLGWGFPWGAGVALGGMGLGWAGGLF